MEQIVMKHHRTTLERAEKFISSEYFTDVNLYGRLYPCKHPVTSLKHWAAPQDRYTSYEEAIRGHYTEAKVGEKYGPTWATHWFIVKVDIPSEWVGSEAMLKWNSGSEAMVWVDGQPKQGLSAGFDRFFYPLAGPVQSKKLSVYIEMACNELFGAGENGMINPANPDKYFTLSCCEVVVFDRQVYNLIKDVELLYSLAKHLPKDSQRGYQALYTVNEVINSCDVADKKTFQRCHDIADRFLGQKNGDSQHMIHAMGHSHIDTAWLWPYSETIRKCARSWSCTIRLMEKYPDFKFTCSQAQQYEWVKERYPGLYNEIKKFVKSGQFVPVGGSWVEMDGNIPSGEAFVRQFLYGQKFFKKEFGIVSKEVQAMKDASQRPERAAWADWLVSIQSEIPENLYRQYQADSFALAMRYISGQVQSTSQPQPQQLVQPQLSTLPQQQYINLSAIPPRGHQQQLQFAPQIQFWLPDTFGYSAQLPQIMRHCGMTRFLTQKLSWNLFNRFPHHTFWWEGIDGSEVLSHFPPGDNYCMRGEVEEILKTANNFQDKGRSDKSVYLFGYGDGGNGPSEDMLEKLKRVQDVDGLPRVKLSTPDEYFGKVEAEDSKNLCHWAGELYLELHNGTYTTQAKVKKMNRHCELLLQDVESLSAIASFSGSEEEFVYPQAELTRLWKLLLLNQFHDVLPGTSITVVYEDAHKYYNDIVKSGTLLKQSAMEAVTGSKGKVTEVVWNTLGWQRSEVVTIAAQGEGSSAGKKRKTVSDGKSQTDHQGNKLVHVTVPSYGYSLLQAASDTVGHVFVTQKAGHIILENDLLSARIDSSGRITQLSLSGQPDYNFVDSNCPSNQFVIFDDIPLYWDAWDVMDYHLETRKPVLNVIAKAKVIDKGPLRKSVQFSLRVSDSSTVKQTIILDTGCPYLKFETEVSWHESHKFLKVEFPTSIHSREVTYEIQYGHLQRPNHYNTSWDSARFEVCGHKWADISEYGRGVAILNDSKYGYSAQRNVLRLSLRNISSCPRDVTEMAYKGLVRPILEYASPVWDPGGKTLQDELEKVQNRAARLRAPKAPDNKADMGNHTFTYAIMPHKGCFQEAGVIQAAYNLNNPLFVHHQNILTDTAKSFFSISSSQVILETVKKAEDDDSCLVLRLYEAFGGHCETTLKTGLPFRSVRMCSGLEELVEGDSDLDLKVSAVERSIKFKVKPFQIVSLMMQM